MNTGDYYGKERGCLASSLLFIPSLVAFSFEMLARSTQPHSTSSLPHPTQDLFENREAFTGYDGKGIWAFIHEKICFPEENFNSKLGTEEGALWQRDFNRYSSTQVNRAPPPPSSSPSASP
jgi:hypothetical protein